MRNSRGENGGIRNNRKYCNEEDHVERCFWLFTLFFLRLALKLWTVLDYCIWPCGQGNPQAPAISNDLEPKVYSLWKVYYSCSLWDLQYIHFLKEVVKQRQKETMLLLGSKQENMRFMYFLDRQDVLCELWLGGTVPGWNIALWSQGLSHVFQWHIV